MKQLSGPSVSLELRPSDAGYSQTFLDIEELYDSLLIMRCTGATASKIEVTINGRSRRTFDRLLLEQGIPL